MHGKQKEAVVGAATLGWLSAKMALLAKGTTGYAAGALALAPPLAGITAGYLSERATAPRDTDFRQAQKDIELQDYEQAIMDLEVRVAKQKQMRELKRRREQERTLHV